MSQFGEVVKVKSGGVDLGTIVTEHSANGASIQNLANSLGSNEFRVLVTEVPSLHGGHPCYVGFAIVGGRLVPGRWGPTKKIAEDNVRFKAMVMGGHTPYEAMGSLIAQMDEPPCTKYDPNYFMINAP